MRSACARPIRISRASEVFVEPGELALRVVASRVDAQRVAERGARIRERPLTATRNALPYPRLITIGIELPRALKLVDRLVSAAAEHGGSLQLPDTCPDVRE